MNFIFLYLLFDLFLQASFCSSEIIKDYILKFVISEKCLNEACDYENHANLIKEKLNLLDFVQFEQVFNSRLLQDIQSINNFEIIYYRKNIPILFDATIFNLEDLQEWIVYNKESKVNELNDDNFEHLTQASTGSTTGDWIILFFKKECLQILPLWEALASNFNQRLMTASIDIDDNVKVAQRFSISECPSVKYLRHGKIYDFNVQIYSLSKLTAFADGWYKNSPSKKVPNLPTPFDILTDNIADWLKKNVSQEVLLFIIFSTIIVGSVLLFQLFKPKIPQDLKED